MLLKSVEDNKKEISTLKHQLEKEVNERLGLEQRNAELNYKLMDARGGLQMAQSTLQSVQLSTDQLALKRQTAEGQIQHLTSENNNHISRISMLEIRLWEAEEKVQLATARRDDFVHKLQSQLENCQEVNLT